MCTGGSHLSGQCFARSCFCERKILYRRIEEAPACLPVTSQWYVSSLSDRKMPKVIVIVTKLVVL